MQTLVAVLLALAAAAPDTAVIPLKEIVVSATKTPQQEVNIPNATAVISGAELRRRGTQTLADALQDIVGLDTGNGSDNGMRLPNIGLWGLKEFDALLVTLDGVPIGGPFNPSLSQIPVEDLDRIEIVKGPQGTLYGVSAFAGMIQAFSRTGEQGIGHLTLGGGSFSDRHAAAGLQQTLPDGTALRLAGSLLRSDGWQDRTGSEVDRGNLGISRAIGGARLGLSLVTYRDLQKWGTPLPFDAGEPLPGFETDRNYAVGGAAIEHRVSGMSSQASVPLRSSLRLENTVALTRDRQRSLRSFVSGVSGDTVTSEGVQLSPIETSVFEDLRLVSRFKFEGSHELVGGTALTWGRTTAEGIGFDFEQFLSAYPSGLAVGDIPVGDHRRFSDRRTFFGAYLHDAWTPLPRLTLAGGGRYDRTSEKLSARAQEVGGPLELSEDSRSDAAWSGDASVLVRAAPSGTPLQAANLYATYKSSFKPAAPNLTEAENAEILRPERTHSVEAGLKTRAFDRQLSLDLSIFQMDFNNLVVSILGPSSEPELTNAGKERFKGAEVGLGWSPKPLPGASLMVGYAHHDVRFVEFTFVTPDGALRNVSGKMLELVPRDLFNVKLLYAPAKGLGAFAATRYQGRRPLNRRNTFFADPYTEWDAGVSFDLGTARLVFAGHNLGDDRHVVSESDIGDSQFYVSPPRRITGELTARF